MNFLAVNFLAIIVAAIAYMVLGFLWYGPFLGKQWMALRGMTQDQMQQGGPSPIIYLVPFVGALVSIYVLALIINAAQMRTLLGGVAVGLLAGIGFLAPAFGANYLFGRGSFPLYLIDVSYPIISLIISGAILGLWR